MIPLFLALIIAFGVGGTVVASDSARPGDLLFPVDRAVEDVRFAFTPGERKAELKIKFANERLDEFESIVSDETDESRDDTATSTRGSGFSEEAENNLSHALDILTSHLAEIHGLASTTPGVAQPISVLEERLLSDANMLPQELRVKIRDDRGQVELRTEDGKFRVEVKQDGTLRVNIESEDDDNNDEVEDRVSRSDDTNNSNDDSDDNDDDSDSSDDD